MPEPVGNEVDDLAADAEDALDQMNRLLDEDDNKSGGERREEDQGGKSEDDDSLTDILPPKKDKDRKEESEEEEQEEGEEEEEEEDDLLGEEEKAELESSGEPKLIKDIEKKYPKIFKEFKPLRIAIMRDTAFSQLFGTPREAAEISQLNDDYREFEAEILQGNGPKVLSAIKQTNADGFKRFVNNFLPALREVDEGSYRAVTYPVLAEVLALARTTGEARGDKNLVYSTKHLASLIWPSLKGEIPKEAAPERTNPELEERERRLAEREREAEQRESKAFVGSVKSNCQRLLRKRIEKGLDPNNVLSPFLKNSVVEKTMASVQELLDEDTQFNHVMQRTFGRARRSGYSNEYKTRMVGTFLGRATQLIGPIRRRLLLAALGKNDSREDGRNKPPMRRDAGEGVVGGGRERALKASEIDFEHSSDLDIISGRAKSLRQSRR
jgi:hypothetical protein